MRFLENGPNIPNQLLEQLSIGNVVFFCGAGISLRAGLPDFSELTKKLIQKLGAEKAEKALASNENYDLIFNKLIEKFGSKEIGTQMYQLLRTPRKPYLDYHRIILDLSKNAAGIPQIVTTNFDLLFEKVHNKLPKFIPPFLPNLSLNGLVEGIVYLHGRLQKPDNQTKTNYVISSADFGRAYLAEGWAARFVKQLRERYTIVLVGYSANDPPMRYLLEGLHSQEHINYKFPIYTFACGTIGEAEEEWRDTGVTPIIYDKVDSHHSGLWDSLSAWTDASRDLNKWHDKIITLAQQRPSELKAFERGQVANLISNKAGAKLFASASPSPCAEWLCVFDPYTRYARPAKSDPKLKEPDIDPLNLFGLDDDPARPPVSQNGTINSVGRDYLKWMPNDTSSPEKIGLIGTDPVRSNPLRGRLQHLSSWFVKIAHEPAAVWWAAGCLSLNPNLAWFIDCRLKEDGDFPASARKFWQLYLENSLESQDFGYDHRFYGFKAVQKQNGWSNYTFREFERANQPSIIFSRSQYCPPAPPQESWDEVLLERLVEMKVKMSWQYSSGIVIPDEHLAKVIDLVRQSLVRASSLHKEVNTPLWRLPTLHPSEDSSQTYHEGKDFYFLWFVELFRKLIDIDPIAAQSELSRWHKSDYYFFGKLSIYAHMYPELASGSEAAIALLDCNEKIFWSPYNHRELLFTLQKRWEDFNICERNAIEKKIIKGSQSYQNENIENYNIRKASTAATMFRWLEINECELTPETKLLLPALMKADPQWTDKWAKNADYSYESRGGVIQTITELRGLEKPSIGQIIQKADELTEDKFGELKNYRPFQGLVKNFPFKSLSALRLEAKRSNYPVKYWKNILLEWPEKMPPRLNWLAAHTFSNLPTNVALELRHYLPDWFLKNLKGLADNNPNAALSVFDKVVANYISAPIEITKSGLGATTIGGIEQIRSEVSIDKAINSPCGILTECVFLLLGTPKEKGEIPTYISSRLTVLFNLSGDAGGHAVCIAASRMGFLDYYFPKWVQNELVPLFSLNNTKSEAAWHGRAFDNNHLSKQTIKMLIPDLLKLLSNSAPWKLDENAYQHHVRGLVKLSRKNGKKRPLISFIQARKTLVSLSDSGRSDALFTLSLIIEETGQWNKFVKPFIKNCWPKQLEFRSEETSRAFARLIDYSGEDYADVIKTVLQFLIPLPHLDMITHRLIRDEESDKPDLVRLFPKETLQLMNALISDTKTFAPYNLSRILDAIAESDTTLQQHQDFRRLKDVVT